LFDFPFLFFFKTTRKGGTIHARKRRHDRGQGSTLGWWWAWYSRDGVARGVGWDAQGSEMAAVV
jgi:hypothetical protein